MRAFAATVKRYLTGNGDCSLALMALFVSLARNAAVHDLGTHEAVELAFAELRVAGGGPVLAKHLHNRWIAGEGEPYSHLHIDGPLTVAGTKPDERQLGPYQRLSMYDGVAYVDGRVFAFTDLEERDWYIHDVGRHWPYLKVAFHETGP